MTAKGNPISGFRQSRGNWNGKQTAQLEETTYSFSGGDEEVRYVADEDDEVGPQ
jgi:hypothetical protein